MEHWQMYLFQYVVGGTLFLFALLLCLRSGDIDLKIKGDRVYTIICFLGLIAYAAAHGLWTWLAINTL